MKFQPSGVQQSRIGAENFLRITDAMDGEYSDPKQEQGSADNVGFETETIVSSAERLI